MRSLVVGSGIVLLSFVVTACGPSVPDARVVSLAELPSPGIEGSRAPDGRARFRLEYDARGGCIALAETVTAFVDDRPIKFHERGRSALEECNGDCALEGGKDKVYCVEPLLDAGAMPPAGTPFVLTITDGTTTWRAAFPGAPALEVTEPASGAVTVGDRVALHVDAAEEALGTPSLVHPDKTPVYGAAFDTETKRALPDGSLSYELDALYCEGQGTTFDVEVTVPVELPSTTCEDLASCKFVDLTPPRVLHVTYPPRRGCS